MEDVSRRRLLGAGGGLLAAAGVASTVESGALDDLGGAYDADDPGYLDLLVEDDWLPDAVTADGGFDVRRVEYVDSEAVASVGESLPPATRRYLRRPLFDHADLFLDPAVVSEYVYTRGSWPRFRVGRLQPDADPEAVAADAGVPFEPIPGTDLVGRVDEGGVQVVAEDVLFQGYWWGEYFGNEMDADRESELLAEAASVVEARPESPPVGGEAVARLRRVADAVGAPTYAALHPSVKSGSSVDSPLGGLDGVAHAAGFDVGRESTALREVVTFAEDPDVTAVRERRDAASAYDGYRGVTVRSVDDAVWLTGETPTHRVDLLSRGRPAPPTSFDFRREDGTGDVVVTYVDGPALPANRVQVATWLPDSAAADVATVDVHFGRSQGQVEPGDVATVPGNAIENGVVVRWLELETETASDWRALADATFD
ncbi:hypothetical protein [Halorubellus sp. PRR65]|uniref:hypothetical protein n=1 Tax=Halorubellus sp. PRR65 TaxID=3098148 RepID=UPI002B2633FB|nr:hypothetical protein [Halorubellus sp. PRR65]